MIIFYGYRRSVKDAKAVNADKVYIDMGKDRSERATMMTYECREGDVLKLFALRDLGGSPVADKKWKAMVEARGVEIVVVSPERPAVRLGRPAHYKPDPAAFRRHRAIWLDPTQSISARLKAISADHGREVTRSMCNNAFGWPGREKPVPEWAAK